jgi:predicted nuclease of restriction endonuclease-like (RecB) superfamily
LLDSVEQIFLMQGDTDVAKRKQASKKKVIPAEKGGPPALPERLLDDVRALIQETRQAVAQAVNSALVMLYWSIGARIRTEVLKEKRAEYGKGILATLSQELTAQYGKGYTYDNLTRMVKLVELFPDREIVATLSKQLGWSHFVEIIPLEKPLQREFYAEMCRVERWTVRALREKIQSMLYERTALSRKPDELARQELAALRDEDRLGPDLVFRDPYVLDFLNLADVFSEDDLETAILREIERFLIELGGGFAFVARQKLMVIDGKDFHLDLLFYHRRLHRLVAVELKIGAFDARDKGQMELYLRWLEKHDREPGEETPLGLILCADKADEQIELLQLERSGIRVASYLTELPSQETLRQKLHDAVRVARARLGGLDDPVSR